MYCGLTSADPADRPVSTGSALTGGAYNLFAVATGQAGGRTVNERAVIFKDSLPVLALGPGRHLLWGTRLTEQRFDLGKLVFNKTYWHTVPKGRV